MPDDPDPRACLSRPPARPPNFYFQGHPQQEISACVNKNHLTTLGPELTSSHFLVECSNRLNKAARLFLLTNRVHLYNKYVSSDKDGRRLWISQSLRGQPNYRSLSLRNDNLIIQMDY